MCCRKRLQCQSGRRHRIIKSEERKKKKRFVSDIFHLDNRIQSSLILVLLKIQIRGIFISVIVTAQ